MGLQTKPLAVSRDATLQGPAFKNLYTCMHKRTKDDSIMKQIKESENVLN